MSAAGVGRIVFSSTAATYGEPDDDPIVEDAPTAPVNPYGNSKLAVDRMLSDEARAHGLPPSRCATSMSPARAGRSARTTSPRRT